jgi:hypothetical protein
VSVLDGIGTLLMLFLAHLQLGEEVVELVVLFVVFNVSGILTLTI